MLGVRNFEIVFRARHLKSGIVRAEWLWEMIDDLIHMHRHYGGPSEIRFGGGRS